ncbi:hypothetical protein SAMN04515620_12840 [Collimonas sp. OK607]|uniref:hypothetical protein n=1 Tax=Collimonas sp. OK607 TaxID=1798194 RepID=UPI0008EABE53|nr:hypothetical protein [Collimonas sp. OK607]SFB23312.1 hypothetical protein SAMN04515620_12840 [Collimonas sp. OK607]
MSQHLSQLFPQSRQQFRLLSLMLLFAFPALSTYAAGPVTSPNPVIQSIPASSGGSSNNLSTEDKKKLLAAPETDAQANPAGSGVIFQGGNYCDDLQQQIKRTQPATGSLNQTANGKVPQYDERSKLEARYRSECVK